MKHATTNMPTVGTSWGKWRRLHQVASRAKTFSILAIDHRGPLRRRLEAEAAGRLPAGALGALKRDVVRLAGDAASAVLLDPETAVAPCLTTPDLPGPQGLVVALDTGSTGDPANKSTSLIQGWSVEKTARLGAAAVKLLVYYHPDAPEAAEVEGLVCRVGEACEKHELPFFLEPLSHQIDPARSPLPSAERRDVVVRTAHQLGQLGADVLKLEFPLDIDEQTDEVTWREACQEVTEASPVPWVLLSAGVTYERFERQAAVACDAGASGVMAGRAVWSEAVTLDVSARHDALERIARPRMESLRRLCDLGGRPFDEVLQPPRGSDAWYQDY